VNPKREREKRRERKRHSILLIVEDEEDLVAIENLHFVNDNVV